MDGFSQYEQESLALAQHFIKEGKVDSPLFIFSDNQLQMILNLFRTHMPCVKLFYAIKANSLPIVAEYFAREGLGVDVASNGEIKLALDAGFNGNRMVLSNPIKDDKSIHAIFNSGIKSYTFDNEAELRKIAAIKEASSYKHNPEAIVRIRIESQDVQIDLNEKFGCSLQEAVSLIKLAYDLGLNPGGVQFHVGTQSYLADNFINGIDSALLIARVVKERFGIQLSTLNIGGGFPDPLVAKKHGIILEDLFAAVGEACLKAVDRGFGVIAEPGRVLVSSAATFVTKVIGKSVRHGQTWLFIDDGVYGAFSGKFFDHKSFNFIPVRSNGLYAPHAGERSRFVVAGPTCDSIDIVSEHTLLPSDINIGDHLCCLNMGAYSYSTASSFNGFGEFEARIASYDKKTLKTKELVSKNSNLKLAA